MCKKTSTYVSLLLIIIITIVIQHVININNNKTRKSFTERAEENGFKSKAYQVSTEDGYMLTIHRLYQAKCEVHTPILLLPGAIQISDAWLDSGPKSSLVYLLAHDCCDVWLGNVRGTYHGRKHETLDVDDDKFWEFTTDEMGYYDVPALVDFVLNETGEEKLDLIGFSQGAGISLMMLSERIEYQNKINSFVAMSPAAKMVNTKSFGFRFSVAFFSYKLPFCTGEILCDNCFVSLFLRGLCSTSGAFTDICKSVLTSSDPQHPDSITPDTVSKMYWGYPAGISRLSMVKYNQAFNTDAFQKIDYGKIKNLVKYGSQKAPNYDVSKIKIPVLVTYSDNDNYIDRQDVLWLVGKLNNVRVGRIDNEVWGHHDVCYSQFVPDYLYPIVKKYLEDMQMDK